MILRWFQLPLLLLVSLLFFTFYMGCVVVVVVVVRSIYFKIISASFLITFLSPEIAVPVNRHVPFPLLQIMMSGFL